MELPGPLLTSITVTGLLHIPTTVALNGNPIESFNFVAGQTFKLFITNLSISMDTEFNLTWI